METVLALVRSARSGKLHAREFRRTLQSIRYRGGKIDGYASRLHYFTDWIIDNQKKKTLKDVRGILAAPAGKKKFIS